MILSKEVSVKINSANYKHFSNLGYLNLKVKNEIIVPISHLSQGSHTVVRVMCDICKNEKNLQYKRYLSNYNNGNCYCCSIKCSSFKSKNTNLKKYGLKNYRNVEKAKNTSFERYGVDYPNQSEDINTKSQKHGYKLKIHKDTKILYQGSYEKDFLDLCFKNHIDIKRGKRIEYTINGEKHYYFSDFYLKSLNLIIEIKSSWTYNLHINLNILKEKYTINSGYRYLTIINKNYKEFEKLINI